MTTGMAPAALAFDGVAEEFDQRFGAWGSVAAQRRAVRQALLQLFPEGAELLEIGGGTGEDAVWLMAQGRRVILTDASPAMIRVAAPKLQRAGAPEPAIAAAEELGALAAERERRGAPLLDGAFSNFAALNCVSDLAPVGQALARMIRPGGHLALVLFGTAAPGEVVTQCVRGDVRSAFRRWQRGDVAARLSGRHFVVRYHRARAIRAAFAPWFSPGARRGIGVFVPPSAAEPWISRHPRLLHALERLDRVTSRVLAPFGDHILYEFTRSAHDAPVASA